MIIGRKKELALLQGSLKDDCSHFVAVYGRRRVGKTFLVREAFGYAFTFQHAGTAKKNKPFQLEAFRRSLIDSGLDDCPVLNSWFDAFDSLKKVIKVSKKRKKIIFIDEISWMDTPRADFLPCLEQFWNGWASARKDIVLIICASATSWIINKVVKDKGGLHNRVTKKIHLYPFTLKECEEYLESRDFRISRKQIVNLYMVLGGVAYYWSLLERSMSVSQNINELFFAKDAGLSGEFDALYAALFKTPDKYIAIVNALGNKGQGLTRQELIDNYGLQDNGALTKCLEELECCDLIRRYNAYGKETKDTLYQLIDNYTLFYFKFIRYNKNGETDFWIKSLGSPIQNSWAGLAFERVCLQHVDQIKKALGIGSVSTCQWSWIADRKKMEAGEKGTQIDLLLDRKDEIINICEMKWCSGLFPLSKEESEKLENRRAAFIRENNPTKSVHITMITTFGLKENIHSDVVQSEVVANDLFC